MEGCFFENVFEEELAENVVLDLEGDGVEVLLLFEEDGSAIVLPEEAEVLFNIVFKL